jgi:hypothetical protein
MSKRTRRNHAPAFKTSNLRDLIAIPSVSARSRGKLPETGLCRPDPASMARTPAKLVIGKPTEPIEGRTPASPHRFPNATEVNWLP